MGGCGGSNGTSSGEAGVSDAALSEADGDLADGASDAGDAGAGDAGGGADAARPTVAETWRPQVIYLAMPDRFFDGDPSNNASGAPSCYDPQNPRARHGGDLAGLRQKQAYLSELGVSALWVTPLNRQSS